MPAMSDRKSEEPTPDSQISQTQALEYWNLVSANVDGMLGGFPQISRTDLQGSANFLAKLRRKAATESPRVSSKLRRAVDCGAGIGRITKGLLCRVAECVDIVEPVEKFTKAISEGADFERERQANGIGKIYNVGLEQWQPEEQYDLMWHQWCCGQLTDAQLVAYFARCRAHIDPSGWLVVKENISTALDDGDIYDDADSSVTRADAKFRSIFEEAGFAIVATETQKGFPKNLFPVRIYALRPKAVHAH